MEVAEAYFDKVMYINGDVHEVSSKKQKTACRAVKRMICFRKAGVYSGGKA
jgi:hypothetical protein